MQVEGGRSATSGRAGLWLQAAPDRATAQLATHCHYLARCEEILCGSVRRLLVTANVVPSSPIRQPDVRNVCSYKIHTDIPEYGNLHSHRRETLKSYRELTGWTV
jgi:hypothetical protein